MKVVAQSQKHSLVFEITSVFIFVFLMIISAYLRIPLFFTPVPITLQTFILYISVVMLRKKAILVQIIYISLGILGLPVFSQGGVGYLYLIGPTGGYIIGFLIVALIFPYLVPSRITFLKGFFTFLLANILIYFFGVLWLISFHRYSVIPALAVGVLPFLIGDLFKIVLASLFSQNYYNR